MTSEPGSAPRKLSVGLIVGIALFPIVFAWFTLRKGYSPTQRAMAFGWLVLLAIVMNSGKRNREETQSPVMAAESTPAATAPRRAEPIAESCFALAQRFGASSKLSDLQKEEAWKAYKGKAFEWDLSITDVSSGMLSGYTVQAKCSPKSTSLIQDIQLGYDGKAKAFVMGLEKGQSYKIRGVLRNSSSILGMTGDGAP